MNFQAYSKLFVKWNVEMSLATIITVQWQVTIHADKLEVKFSQGKWTHASIQSVKVTSN